MIIHSFRNVVTHSANIDWALATARCYPLSQERSGDFESPKVFPQEAISYPYIHITNKHIPAVQNVSHHDECSEENDAKSPGIAGDGSDQGELH